MTHTLEAVSINTGEVFSFASLIKNRASLKRFQSWTNGHDRFRGCYWLAFPDVRLELAVTLHRVALPIHAAETPDEMVKSFGLDLPWAE